MFFRKESLENDRKRIEATLVKRTSKKGNDYECVMVQLTPTYQKMVLLEKPELELLKAVKEDADSKSSSKLPFDK